MAVSVRFHREDPWELVRLMRAAMPKTRLNFITTGMRFIAWQPCDEDVMRLAFRCVVRNGIRRFQFAEPANDPEALRRVARMAREEGVEEIVVGSPIRSARCTHTRITPNASRRWPIAPTSTASISRIRAAC